MSDTTSPPTYTFTITLLTLPAGASAPVTNTWQVNGSAVGIDRECYVVTDATGDVVALAPFGALVVRDDAVAQSTAGSAA